MGQISLQLKKPNMYEAEISLGGATSITAIGKAEEDGVEITEELEHNIETGQKEPWRNL